MNENMQRKGKAVLGTVEVPFDTLVQYRGMLVETANNIEAFVKKQLNPLLGTEKLMNQISADEKEAQEEPDAIYNSEKKGFVCNYEGCSEGRFYETIEIVEHIQKKHKVEPDDQIIEGWTDADEKAWRSASRKAGKKTLKQRAKKKRKGGQEKPIKRIPLTELQRIAPPSYYATTRRITQCPKDCPNLAEQNKCTSETCINVGKNRPTFKEIYCLAKNQAIR
jgi:hypothetical protein